jgi:acyl-CoA thioesterase-1
MMTPNISRIARTLLVVMPAALLAACGGPASPKPDPAPAPSQQTAAEAVRIVVLGDSIAAGLGLPGNDAFPAIVEDLLRREGHSVDVVNAGVSGDTSAGGLRRIDWILKQRPDILVVELGGNDALRGQPLGNTERNLRQIIRRGQASGAHVLLVGMDIPSNYGPVYAGGFAAMYKTIARDERATLVPDFVREVGTDSHLMQADGIHPTAAGHRRLAENLLPYLEDVVKEVE